MTVALLIAGGVGNRMGQDIPKQFINVNDKPVIIYTLEAFQNHPSIDAIEVVCLEGWSNILASYCKQFSITKLRGITNGGKTGQESIKAGLFAIKEFANENDIVMVHDAIRPMVSPEIISDNLRVCKEKGNAITAIPCAEAMLVTKDGRSSIEQINRATLKRTQTPQSMFLKDFLELHKKAQERGITNSVATCTLAIELGREVFFSLGSEKNIKLTTTDDIDIFKALLLSKRSEWLK